MTDRELGTALVGLARGSVAAAVGVQPPVPADPAGPEVESALDAPGATFVTLTLDGRLRGCIGSLEARRPLRDDCVANARAAALRDPRFSPVSRREYDGLQIEVSVLSKPEPMRVASEDDALAQLRPGTDGVLLEAGRHRATFLPQVWEQLPEPRAFMTALKRKAGLPERSWDDSVRLSRYTVRAYEEE